jgi:hypothetical protein
MSLHLFCPSSSSILRQLNWHVFISPNGKFAMQIETGGAANKRSFVICFLLFDKLRVNIIIFLLFNTADDQLKSEIRVTRSRTLTSVIFLNEKCGRKDENPAKNN